MAMSNDIFIDNFLSPILRELAKVLLGGNVEYKKLKNALSAVVLFALEGETKKIS